MMEIGAATQARNESGLPENTLRETGLDRDAFLKLFLAQLEHQDPLNPQDATQLATQLAQFSEFEQSLRMVTELRGINSRLDDLIAARGGAEGTIVSDPLTLLGREVEFEGNRLAVPGAGVSAPVRFELPSAAQRLAISVADPLGQPLGQVLLEPASGAASHIPAGSYELTAGNGARLRGPEGIVVDLAFTAVRRAENGTIELVPAEGGGTAGFSLEPGRSYRIAVDGTSADGRLLEVDTTTVGTVEAVRNDPTRPVVVIDGMELELSQVLNVR